MVGTAGSVRAAQAMLEDRPPDVVLLDVEMPGGRGFDLLLSVPAGTLSVRLRGKGRTALIPIGDICWIESLRNYTRVGLMNPGRILFFRRRLGEWEADLPTGLFERLGKSLVVQIALIQETEWKSRDETVLTFAADIEPLVIGRLAAMRLRDVLGEGSDGRV